MRLPPGSGQLQTVNFTIIHHGSQHLNACVSMPGQEVGGCLGGTGAQYEGAADFLTRQKGSAKGIGERLELSGPPSYNYTDHRSANDNLSSWPEELEKGTGAFRSGSRVSQPEKALINEAESLSDRPKRF